MGKVLTKTEQVMVYIREGILSGKWADSGKLPSEGSMMSELGVSRPTYREALAALSSEDLITRKFGSGIYINSRTSRTTVAVLARDTMISAPMAYWYRDLIDRWKGHIAEENRKMVLAFAHGASDKELCDSVALFGSDAVKDTGGVLALLSPDPFKEILSRYSIPLVFATPYINPGSHWPTVFMDKEAEMRAVQELMSAAGYQDFAVMYADSSGQGHSRYVEICQQRCMEWVLRLVNGDRDRLIPVPYSADCVGAYIAFKTWWESAHRCRAVYFADDGLFDIAGRAIVDLGIRVPEDLALMTYANTGRRFVFPVDVTSVGFDPDEVAAKAWHMLRKLMRREEMTSLVETVEPVVIERASL